jgi:hypothetical protein
MAKPSAKRARTEPLCSFSRVWPCPLCSEGCRPSPTQSNGVKHCRQGTCFCANETGWGGRRDGAGKAYGDRRLDRKARSVRRVECVKERLAQLKLRTAALEKLLAEEEQKAADAVFGEPGEEDD